MSSCLILQDKNNYYIGADTACSTKINDTYYRVHDDMQKIFQHNHDTFFCSGNVCVVDDVVSWIRTNCANKECINEEQLSKYLKTKYLANRHDVFDIEVVICRKATYSHAIQLSQYNNFDIVDHIAKDDGVNIICCGYRTQDMYDMSCSMLMGGITNINTIYQNVFDNISDNKVGGTIILYKNGSKEMCNEIHEHNIEYANMRVGQCHLLLANAVVAGYIEGSKMRGGTIQIGDLGNDNWSFEVDENGNVSMLGGAVQFNSTTNSLGDAVNTLNQTIGSNTSTLQSQIDGINSAKMYKVEIVSDGPSIFSTKEDKATMKCVVYSWDADITETLDASIFNWKRVSDNTSLDEIWNARPEHQGVKSIAINADDVIANSSFTCEVNLPE